MEYCMEISGVTKNYGNFSLDNVSFNLSKGCIMGFIGKNGAGKSTTIKAILNIIRKESGTIKIFGLDIDEPQNERIIKEQVGVVLDENHFQEMFTLKDINCFMTHIYSNWDEKLYWHYADHFELPKDKTIKKFSKGMTMKLNIAVALAHKPKLLILDEATSGLDPVVRTEILDIFLEFIQDEEHSILMSSHITSDLEKISDYISFIHRGRIILSGSKDDMLFRHAIVKCGAADFENIDKSIIVSTRKSNFQYEVLVNSREYAEKKHSNLVIDNASLEDIMLFYTKE